SEPRLFDAGRPVVHRLEVPAVDRERLLDRPQNPFVARPPPPAALGRLADHSAKNPRVTRRLIVDGLNRASGPHQRILGARLGLARRPGEAPPQPVGALAIVLHESLDAGISYAQLHASSSFPFQSPSSNRSPSRRTSAAANAVSPH